MSNKFVACCLLAVLSTILTACTPTKKQPKKKVADKSIAEIAKSQRKKVKHVPLKAPRNNQSIIGEKILALRYTVKETWGNVGKGMKWEQVIDYELNEQGNWKAQVTMKRVGAEKAYKTQTRNGFFNFKDFADLKELVFQSDFMTYNDIHSQVTPAGNPYSDGVSTLTIITEENKHTVKWTGHSVVSIREIHSGRSKLPLIKQLFIWLDKRMPRFNRK